MKKTILITLVFIGAVSGSFAQTTAKTYYDEAKTKLKEVYAYTEVNTFSIEGDHKITEVKQIKNGPYFYYFETGKLKISGNYANDKKNGTWKYYDEQGNIVKTEVYKNGELVTTN